MASEPFDVTTPDPVVHVDWRRLRRWAHTHRQSLLNRSVWSAAAILAALPIFGLSDEVLAFTGERVFGVDDLPAVVAPDERTTVYDMDGTAIGHVTGAENRRSVGLDAIPPVLRRAIIATEDHKFFRHEGVDVGGIMRAAVVNVMNLGVKQGGSTITQQYVKNALLTSERSFQRKITEATWAVRLEQQMEKDEILERYLNLVYLGDGNYGVSAAAEYWFGVPVSELDLSQSALLAAMIKAPETLDPATNGEGAGAARDRVLDRMLELTWITADEASEAKAVILANQINVTPLARPEKPHFVDMVTRLLIEDERLGATREERVAALFGGGLQIQTTLDPRRQQHAENVVAAAVSDPANDPMVGIVSVEPGTGRVVAMALGPKAFGVCAEDADPCLTTTVNPLVPGMGSPGRQVGSAIKPIVVAAALEAGVDPAWHTDSTSGTQLEACDGYAPQNYDGASPGTIDMMEAIRTSNNVFHVKLGLAAGLDNVVATAAELGLSELPPYCSVSLGSVEEHPLSMAAAYATFAADGIHCAPLIVTEVRTRSGEVLFREDGDCSRVLSSETAATISTLLRHNAEDGTAKAAAIGRPYAAKTGTTNDYLDAWLVGYTPQLATAVWIGYEQPQPMQGIFGVRNVTGGSIPAQLWGAYMTAAMEGIEVVDIPMLDVARWSCASGGDADSFAEGNQDCAAPKPSSSYKPPKGKGGKGGKGKKK